MKLSQLNKIYFIGIGGIGISAAARIVMEFGKKVYGSDLTHTNIISDLRKLGAKIKTRRQSADQISKDIDIVVYSNAVNIGHAQLKKANKLKIPSYSYPEFLSKIMENYLPIIISGTHGKSTTTAMLAKIFIQSGLDPSVVLGTNIKEFSGNARVGLGRHFICEGDEYKEAFLNYNPVGLIINNIEADHLDYYKNLSNIIKAFKKISQKVPLGGFLVFNADDKNISAVIKNTKCKVISFGINNGDYQASHIIQHGELIRFAVKGLERFDLAIRVPGTHNIYNALAAAVMALAFGIEHSIIKKALLNYQGAWRRFEIKGKKNGVTIVDDYAHHPTEIKATLKAARDYFPNKRIWCIYQPHSFNRTKHLLKELANSFKDCDKLILTGIYDVAGRDKKEKVSIDHLQKEISKTKKKVKTIKDMNKIAAYVKQKTKNRDVVFTMGAGDITLVSDQLLK